MPQVHQQSSDMTGCLGLKMERQYQICISQDVTTSVLLDIHRKGDMRDVGLVVHGFSSKCCCFRPSTSQSTVQVSRDWFLGRRHAERLHL
jgi:hypothetical protein